MRTAKTPGKLCHPRKGFFVSCLPSGNFVAVPKSGGDGVKPFEEHGAMTFAERKRIDLALGCCDRTVDDRNRVFLGFGAGERREEPARDFRRDAGG